MTRSSDPLERRLRSLPPVEASPDFTASVLSRLDRSPSPHARSRRLTWAAVATGIAVVALIALLQNRGRSPGPDLAVEATEIRRQHQLLTQELDRLRALASDAAPVLYLGGLDEVDYVLDLSPFVRSRSGQAVPASTRDPAQHPATRELQ